MTSEASVVASGASEVSFGTPCSRWLSVMRKMGKR